MEVFHDTATGCHLSLAYGITQCYLLPDTSEHTPPCDVVDSFMITLLQMHWSMCKQKKFEKKRSWHYFGSIPTYETTM